MRISIIGSSKWLAGRLRRRVRGIRSGRKLGNLRARWWYRNTQASYRNMLTKRI